MSELRHIPSPEYRAGGAVNRDAYEISVCFDQPSTKRVGATGFLSRPQPSHQRASTAIRPTQPTHPYPLFPTDVSSHYRQQHHQRHRWLRVPHPSLLARHVRSPLAFLTRRPRPTPQETSPSIAIHTRERDSGCRADGGRRSDAHREGLSLDHHSAAARSCA